MKKKDLKPFVAIVQKGDKTFPYPFKSLNSNDVEVKLRYNRVDFDKVLAVHTKEEYEMIKMEEIIRKQEEKMALEAL